MLVQPGSDELGLLEANPEMSHCWNHDGYRWIYTLCRLCQLSSPQEIIIIIIISIIIFVIIIIKSGDGYWQVKKRK